MAGRRGGCGQCPRLGPPARYSTSSAFSDAPPPNPSLASLRALLSSLRCFEPPFHPLGIEATAPYGFPSGHTQRTMMIACTALRRIPWLARAMGVARSRRHDQENIALVDWTG